MAEDVTIGGCRLVLGDCMDVLAGMEPCSVDAVVTDPPYHLTSGNAAFDWSAMGPGDKRPNIGATNRGGRGHKAGFMGKSWDGGDIAFRPETWVEVLRVLKPGGHMVCFGGTRTYHRLACAIEDAGFEIRDSLMWLYGSGFNKVGYIRDPATKEIVREGWAGSLKPSVEPILLARKPLAEPTVAANVLAHGTGALNVDACRVDSGPRPHIQNAGGRRANTEIYGHGKNGSACLGETTTGRWPPNLLHDGSPEVLAAFQAFGERSSGAVAAGTVSEHSKARKVYGDYAGYTMRAIQASTGSAARFYPALGYEPGELRFHYSGKASGEEREGNTHPTLKPVALMQWLCKLVTPPGGVVLDCFAGSGSTGVAASRLGMRAILIEREREYFDLAAERLRNDAPLLTQVRSWVGPGAVTRTDPTRPAPGAPEPVAEPGPWQASLFDEEAA